MKIDESKEIWREQMFELKANGMKTYSYKEWQARRAMQSKIWEELYPRQVWDELAKKEAF